MKYSYRAYSPADEGDLIAEGEIELPDNAGDIATIGALVSAVEANAATDRGSQVRVIASRDGEPHIWHSWDHGE
jgi:hypothetical protein